jgi:hypothetical protein
MELSEDEVKLLERVRKAHVYFDSKASLNEKIKFFPEYSKLIDQANAAININPELLDEFLKIV